MRCIKRFVILTLLALSAIGLMNNLSNSNITQIKMAKENNVVIAGIETRQYMSGSVFGELPTADKQCSKFVGWFTRTIGGTRITSQTPINNYPTGMTFFAQWKDDHRYSGSTCTQCGATRQEECSCCGGNAFVCACDQNKCNICGKCATHCMGHSELNNTCPPHNYEPVSYGTICSRCNQAANESYQKCTRCGDETTPVVSCQHCDLANHTYNKQVTTNTYLRSAATCTSGATYYYSCICGAKGSTTFTSGSAVGHSYRTTIAATCTSSGTETCSTCSNTRTISATGHDWSGDYCTNCDYYRCCGNYGNCTCSSGTWCDCCSAYVNSCSCYGSICETCYKCVSHCSGHTSTGGGTSSQTCSCCGTTGYTQYNCPNCSSNSCPECGDCVIHCNYHGCTHTSTRVETRTGMSVCDTSDCVDLFEVYCNSCNEQLREFCDCGGYNTQWLKQSCDSGSHTYDQELKIKTHLKTAATCTSAAVYYKSCSCGAKGSTTFTSGSVGSHNYSTTVSATCTSSGTETCSTCSNTRTIDATGHDWYVYTSATCTSNGSKKCSTCNTTQTIYSSGHDWSSSTATCTSSGSRSCYNCEATETVASTGHSWTTTTAAACTSNGSKTCDNCGLSQAISAYGHSYEEIDSSQCTCSRCNKTYSHSMIDVPISNQYCYCCEQDNVVLVRRYCEYCGYEQYVMCNNCGEYM